ncbi:MAPEG family protein [Nitrospirillum sp. BR 11828]|uniref:MAPEG family protein n=1 Tax=Nitrospirillum sp. BR 11828 TaxID=3104325 RepID=UPI002ACAC94A|nr:MAPEG family protein [Nitrospirillum sp. BR 11828]MDZ5647666.1 MAPEG family protein [Nitrospirillum sp. BR 11828]
MTSSIALFFPMLALFLFTVLVGLRLFIVRVRAVKRGNVRLSYFRNFTAGTQTEGCATAQRAYGNLLEVPALFYVICVVLMVLRQGDHLYEALAWAYVALRVVQGLIHLSYNNVLHRAAVYMASMAVLTALWVRLGLTLLAFPT